MRVLLHPPNRGSKSARDLAKELRVRRIRRQNSRYRPRWGDVLINWGNPQQMFPSVHPMVYWINDPLRVRRAINKTWAWDRWQRDGVPTVEYTEDHEEALRWLVHDEERVIHRRALSASQGRGCTVYSPDGTQWSDNAHHFDELAFGGAFVKVFGRVPAHVTEYRVHVVGGQVIDFAQKKRRRDHEGPINPYIRSHENGWVFCRDGVELPPVAAEAAVQAVESLGLDFGAVDIAASRDGDTCVYEVNTAPGIEGASLSNYRDALRAYL